ncbi:phage major capsid protein [Pseudoxanthomonas winnipegensis]|uniref:Phage major capsid protein n=1 Tax=Pseudoxanthomonas winnipegensis TaxID=2480810 RepID=A0ABY1WCS5_9GAMM|nr:phage major capsid protein [Pseudoxanthomonas winnipegensis]TAA12472.1 phage major capsid protein [Pseudoxanthomonas winnipegensis]TAA19163.1 phage major capsid protein [Pseudoxanthomonas winnipegensis]TAH70424.1 phage major capsid protein [Pseudoxanthomonas winnipegensis]
MKSMKLSATFYLAVLALVAAVPLFTGAFTHLDGPGIAISVIVALAIVGAAATMIEPSAVRQFRAHTQFGDAGEDVEKAYKQVSADLKTVGDQLKAHAEQVNKQIERNGEMSQETRAKVDELLVKQGELQARQNEVEQRLAAANQGDEQGGEESAGNLVSSFLTDKGVNSSFRGSQRIQVPRAAITSVTGSGGALVSPDRQRGIVAPPEQRLTIRDLVAPGTTSSNSVEYVRETGFTNAARPVAETTPKPYSEITFELDNAPVRTIAHLMKASRQILDDAPALASYIDARARYGLLLAEEIQFLLGNGTGVNILGIVPQAQAFVAPSGVVVTLEQRIDRVRLALLQAELAEFPSDGVVLNPIDWAAIELTKDTTGRYIISSPAEGATPRLWRRPVVETKAMAQNDFLVGAFRLGAQVFDRQEIEVLVSTENDKDFENNMVTIRAEERLAFAVYRPEAFVTGDLVASG